MHCVSASKKIQMHTFRNKYRIPSARAPFWDYGWKAAYFVTICTKYRECWFGEVLNGRVELSEIGIIAESEWIKTFNMREDMNLWMGEFVIMPNHFHAIIGIGNNEFNARHTSGRDAMLCVSGRGHGGDKPRNEFGPQAKNLASVIRGFKIGVTRNARQIDMAFAWQSRYHDHIIRNKKTYEHISEYITNNPQKWDNDTFNPTNQ